MSVQQSDQREGTIRPLTLVESNESDDGVSTGRGVSMAGALRAIERWARSLFRGHVWVTFV